MEPELKQFIRALREKNVRDAREEFEKLGQKLDSSDDFWQGYRLALQGMVNALDGGDELTTIRRLVDGKLSDEQIQKLVGEARKRASSPFRQGDEKGFDAAWVSVLQEFLKGKKV